MDAAHPSSPSLDSAIEKLEAALERHTAATGQLVRVVEPLTAQLNRLAAVISKLTERLARKDEGADWWKTDREDL